MLTEPINTRLAKLGISIGRFDHKPITFSFNGEKYTTKGSSRGRYQTIRKLEYDFEKILSDLINTVDLPDGGICHGDGIRFKREEQRRISISVYDKDREIPERDKKQDFIHALISYYARQCSIDFEDEKIHDAAKLCARDAICNALNGVTLFHRFVGSTCSGSGNMYTDLRASLFDEPEFERFREFKDAPGAGLIEKFFNGLHAQHVKNESENAALRRGASHTHHDLVTGSQSQ